jgi:DNA-binding response OmpR family regulator
VLRRSRPAVSVLALGETTIDFTRMRASRRGEPLELTSREYALLQYLAERAGAVVKRDELLRVVWGYREVPMTRTVDNFVARLRRKIEANPHRPEYIRTMHGDGYCLSVPLER